MKLEYNDSKAFIYGETDCFKGIALLRERERLNDTRLIDLVVTSPPYFDARDYGGNPVFDDVATWRMWCTRLVDGLSKTLKDGGVIWWNTGSGYVNNKKMIEIYKMIVELDNLGIYLIDEIPWIKKSSPPKKINNRPYPAWEHNFIFSKDPENVKFYRDEVRRPYAKSTLKRMEYTLGRLTPDKDGEYDNQVKKVKPNPKGASPRNYLILPQDYTKRPHPAPMLPQLANWAIRAYCPKGGWVLDPLMGVGTTMIESFKLGMNFIGFDLYKEYTDIAKLSFDRLVRGDDPYNGLKKEWESLKNE